MKGDVRMGHPTRWGIAAVVLALGAVPGPLEADGGKKKPAAAPRPALTPGCVRVVEGFNGTLSADGKRLAFTRKGADDSSEIRRIELIGEPASVGDPQSKIIGPIIQLFPQEQRAGVLGAGSMHAMHAPEPGTRRRPLVP